MPYGNFEFVIEPKVKKDYYRMYMNDYVCEVTKVLKGNFKKGEKIIFRGDGGSVDIDYYSLNLNDKFYAVTNKEYLPLEEDAQIPVYPLIIYEDIFYIINNKVYPYSDRGFFEQFIGMNKRKFEKEIVSLLNEVKLKYPQKEGE